MRIGEYIAVSLLGLAGVGDFVHAKPEEPKVYLSLESEKYFSFDNLWKEKYFPGSGKFALKRVVGDWEIRRRAEQMVLDSLMKIFNAPSVSREEFFVPIWKEMPGNFRKED